MRKTKPKIISLLLIASCLLLNCGSRKTDTQKNEKQEQKVETKIEYRDVIKESVVKVRDTVYLERKHEVAQESQQQKKSQKISRKKEYYESGTLKSETEEDVTESELLNQLTLENSYLKSSSVALKVANEKLEEKESAYRSEIRSLKEKSKAKSTEREAYPWYWWVLCGIAIWEILGIIIRKYKIF